MKFEGEDIVIPLRGIERAGADEVQKDGALEDAIGIISRNSSYIPYVPHNENSVGSSVLNMTNDVVIVRVHKTSAGDNVIRVIEEGENSYKIQWKDKGAYDAGAPGSWHNITTISSLENIVFMGNYMILKGMDRLEYWLCYKKNDSISYKLINGYKIDEEFIDIPTVSFKVENGIYSENDLFDAYRVRDYNPAWKPLNWWKNTWAKQLMSINSDTGDNDITGVLTDLGKAFESVKENGGITGYVLVTYAYHRKGENGEAYDCYGVPILLSPPEHYRNDTKRIYYTELQNGNLQERDNCVYDAFVADGSYDAESLYNAIRGEENGDNGISNSKLIKFTDEYGNARRTGTIDYVLARERSFSGGGETPVTIYEIFPKIRFPYAWTTKYLSFMKNEGQVHVMRETFALGSHLSIRVNSNIDENLKEKYDRLAIFMSPIIEPYKKLTNGQVDYTIRDEQRYAADGEGGETAILNISLPANAYTTVRTNATEEDFDPLSKVKHGVVIGSMVPQMKDYDTILNDIKGVKALYKVWEEDMNNIVSGEWVKLDLRNITNGSILNRTALPLNSFYQNIRRTIGTPFVYNHKLHLYGNKISNFFNSDFKSLVHCAGVAYNAVEESEYNDNRVLFEIELENGNKLYSNFTTNIPALTPILILPFKAIKVTIEIRIHGVVKLRTIYSNSEPYAILDGAMTMFVLKDRIWSDSIWLCRFCGVGTPSPMSDDEFNNVPTKKMEWEDEEFLRNQLKWSDTNTITVNTNSLFVGDGAIVGLAKFGINMSQDNFDKYPLVAFCTDGIWPIGLNSDGMYDSCVPVSRLVCTNPKGICSIDSGIVFPTADGLYLFTREGVKNISELARGEMRHVPSVDDGKGKGLKVLHNAISHGQIVNLDNIINGEDLRMFVNLSDTTISYLSELNSLLIYNKNYDYCYTIVLDTLYVFRTNFGVDLCDNNYPVQRFYLTSQFASDGKTFAFSYIGQESETDCYLQTRPIKTEHDVLKATYRVVLRGQFKGSVGRYVGLYVLGSLDGEHWQVVGAKEKELSIDGFKDLGCVTYRTSLKYLMVAMAGRLSTESHIDAFEMTQDVKYNDKLK